MYSEKMMWPRIASCNHAPCNKLLYMQQQIFEINFL